MSALPDGWAGWEDWAGGLTGWEGFTVSFRAETVDGRSFYPLITFPV